MMIIKKTIKALLALFMWQTGPLQPISLPKLETLDLDRSVYSPVLGNDFINIPVDRDLVGWRRYSIRFLPDTPASEELWQVARASNDRLEELIIGGRKVKCSIPKAPIPDTTIVHIPSPQEQELMVQVAMRVLKSFTGCLRHREGWWTYELCHMKRVRQFHVVTSEDVGDMLRAGRKQNLPKVGSVSSDFLLGRFLPKHPGALAIRFGNTFTMTYVDGDRCWTEERGWVVRETEVRFVCPEAGGTKQQRSSKRLSPYFVDVFEDQVCHYVVVVAAPAICQIPQFQAWQRPKLPVLCIADQINGLADPSGEKPAPVDEPKEDPKKKKFNFARLADLVMEQEDVFPMLRKAILDLLRSEVLSDTLSSHLPKKSLFQVFQELKEAQDGVDPVIKTGEGETALKSGAGENAKQRENGTKDKDEDKRPVFKFEL